MRKLMQRDILPSCWNEVLRDLLSRVLKRPAAEWKNKSEGDLQLMCKDLCENGCVQWSHLTKLKKMNLKDMCMGAIGGKDEFEQEKTTARYFVDELQKWARGR